GSDDSCGFLEDAVEAEELCGAALGDEGGEEGAAEGLGAALDDADGSGERAEVPGLLHEVAEDGDAGVGGECDVDPVLRPEPPGEAPEEEGEGDADELDEEERADEVALPDPDLGPVDRGHLDDGLDPVDVEPEGDEELEGVGVASRGAEGFGESAESRADVSDTVVAFRLRALGARLGDVAEQ